MQLLHKLTVCGMTTLFSSYLKHSFLFVACFAVSSISITPVNAKRISNPIAVFSGLDKITGRIITFDIHIDETYQFGALQVTPRICYTSSEDEATRTDGFIEVDEITLTQEIKRIFTGWMFADSPGLNAIEHPVYDVWLKDCKQKLASTYSMMRDRDD